MPTEPLLGLADPVSALTHLLGAIVAAGALPSLMRRAPAASHARLAFAVFGATCIVLLATSGIYHALPEDSAGRELFRLLDHAAIFMLIAGCYTPVHAWLFRGPLRWGVLTGVWGLAIAGLTFKTLFFAAVPDILGTAAYLLLGWLGLGSGWFLWRHHGPRLVALPLVGGVAFSIGAVVEAAGAPAPLPGVLGAHELFHFASLAGIYTFWRFIGREIASIEPPHEAGPPVIRPAAGSGAPAGQPPA